MAVYTSEIRAQAGTQSAFITAVTPTVALRGVEELSLKSANDIEVIGDMTQALAGGDTGLVNKLAGSGTWKGWASYDHLPYWLDAVFGTATPSGTYLRNYAAPTTTRPTTRIMTLVKGDATVGAYKLTGALPTDMTLRVEPAKRMEMSGSLIGTGLSAATLASLSAATVTPIQGSHVGATGLKMDSWAGTMGTTTVTNCTVRFLELMIKPDRAARMCLGSLSASDYVEKPWDGSLKMSLEFNATTKTDIDLFVAGLSQRQVQYTLTTGATQIMVVQFAGTLTGDVEVFRDDDGVATVDFELKRTYHATFANWVKIALTNTISAAAMV